MISGMAKLSGSGSGVTQRADGSSGGPVGLIAGQGRLPVLVAQGIRAAGRQVVCVGLAGQYAPQLPDLCDRFTHAGIARLGKWIRVLSRGGVREAVMIGRVRKAKMYDPLRLIRQLPDLRAIRLWYRVLRHDRRNSAVLAAVADELAKGGITLIDSTQYIREYMAQEGVMTSRQPTPQQLADAGFGWPLVERLCELDIGQAIAVKEREVVAVEAIEGTDAMIHRAGELCRVGGWTLIKTANPSQDMRFDVPTIGPDTIDALHECGAGCLVVGAGRVILADKQELLERADRYGISVVGWPWSEDLS